MAERDGAMNDRDRDRDRECDDALVEAVARELRRPFDLGPALDARVLAELRRTGPEVVPVRGRARPRTRPRLPLALAASLAALAAAGTLLFRPTEAEAVQEVRFTLPAAGSSRVAVVGDFNDWDPAATPLTPHEGGVWSVTLPLAPGRYRYTFVVDGARYVADPAEPRAVDDDFGTPTSVITVVDR